MKTDDDIESIRLRSARSRKRIRKDDFDKKLLRLHKEEISICEKIRNLGWTELKPPVQRGFIRFFVLREDVRRSKRATFYQKVLNKINTSEYSTRKDFKKKKKRFGKKIYVVRDQRLRDVEEREFFGNKFNEHERMLFYEVLTHPKQSKKPVKVYRFIEPWRFVLRVQPNMITRVRIKNVDLEGKSAEINRYFQFNNRRNRLWKLLDGSGRHPWYDDLTNEKIENPLYNRSFHDILGEYLPQAPSTPAHKTLGDPEGSFFYLTLVIHFFLNSHHISEARSKTRIPLYN